MDYFCFFDINEIYLVEKWDNGFWFLYTEIEKIQNRIPCYVYFFGVSATLIKKIYI